MINRFIRCEEVQEENSLIQVKKKPVARYKAIEVGDMCEKIEEGDVFSAYRGSVSKGIVFEDDVLYVLKG